MASKKLKLRVHNRNFSEEELIVNYEALSREKWEVREGDLLEIFPPSDQARTWRSHLMLQVKALPSDIQSKGGPFSIYQDVAVAFSLTGVREVCVRKVEQRDVGLDLVELSFKDQFITRSDMWRITCSLLNRCLYSGKHLQQCTMRLQTHSLWHQGDKVTSGAVITSTKVVFRSTSAQVFLFIQISSEMWEFDPSGEFFFDKAVSGFLRELFVRWREAGCNHDVTIVFFWRLHYDPTTAKSLHQSSSLREDKKRGLFYEDFFRVIVESTSNSDWSCELINIKKSFLKLKPLIQNLSGRANAVLCKSEEGNVLEAINLALNVLERHHVDTNLQLAGQQIVVLTAGTGYFEIDRKLMQLTNERLVYGGVTTDLVSMRDQPLHAMPMFKFHSKEEEFFSVPHWINYSFYSSTEGCGQTAFQPRIYLSDHLVNTYLRRDTSKQTDKRLYHPNNGYPSTLGDRQIPTWVDYDGHDAAIFDLPNSRLTAKVQSSNRVTEVSGKVVGEASDTQSEGNRVTFYMGDPDTDPFDGADLSDSTSPSPKPNSIETALTVREAQLTRSLAPPPRQRYKSENYGDGSLEKLGSSSGTRRDRSMFVSVGSAEGLRQGHTPWGSHGDPTNHFKRVQKKRLTFSNPFDPNKMHSEAPAFQRRWVHVFPTNKRGVAFQIHHEPAADQNSALEVASRPQQFGSAITTPQTSLGRLKRGILKHSIDSSPTASEGGTAGSPGGNSKKSGLSSLKQSPAISLSPREGRQLGAERTGKKGKGSPSINRSPVSVRDKPSSEMSSQTQTPSSSGHASAAATPEKVRRHTHRNSNSNRHFPSSTSENFASVRRTGVDWRSLVEPAHLPITTDFYPAKEILDHDYAQYNTNLIVFREEQDQTDSGETAVNEKRAPVWYSDHSTMTTFQAFLEMISQRLSQGFQLTCPPPSERGGSSLQPSYQARDLNTVYVLHEAVERLKDAKKNRKNRRHSQHYLQTTSITVHMGLSHVFHKLVLAFPDISVFIYRQKSAEESSPWLYSYQLSSSAASAAAEEEEEEFQCVPSQFAITSDDYNWNYLDHHVCGYSDFEDLGESLRYWELRYLLLPKQCPSFSPPPLLSVGSGSVSSEQTAREQEALISNFVRFLEFLNFKKGVVGSKRMSQASIQSLAPQKNKASRRSMPAALTPHTSLSPSPTPTPTPTPSHTSTPSRTRQLSEIEEEEKEKKKLERQDTSSSSLSSASAKNEAKREPTGEREGGSRSERGGSDVQQDRGGESGERGGVSQSGSGSKSARHWKRLSSVGVEVRVEKSEQSSHTRPESPSTASRRDYSKSPSLTPRREDSKLSPKTERRKIVAKLRKLASDDSVTSDDGGERLKPLSSQPVSAQTLSALSPSVPSERERENDLESSLDHYKWTPEGSLREGAEEVPAANVYSPLDVILRAMESETDGIDFVSTETGLQKGCFVSMDAVKWLMENVRGVGTRRQATKILQSMITEQLVVHASGDPTVPFLDGYFFYYIPHKESKDETPRQNADNSFFIVNREFDNFSKKWFETEIEFASTAVGDVAADDSSNDSSPRHSLASSFKTGHPYYMGYEYSEDTYVPPILNRRVELNPDPHFHSCRPEWCYVHYDPVYNPKEAFQLMFQWMVATTNLLSTLIQSWVRNASMCGFNLVAVPVHKSLQQDSNLSTHPFRKPSFMPLSLPPEIRDKWTEEEKEGGKFCLVEGVKKLLLAVASRNGFLRDCAQVAPEPNILSPNFADPYDLDSHHFYIHHTGTALIQPLVEQLNVTPLPAAHTSSVSSPSTVSGTVHSTVTTQQHWLHPYPPRVSSTPLVRSPAKRGRSGREGSVCSEEAASPGVTENGSHGDAFPGNTGLRYGFYWHKNYLLPKQKNAPSGLVGRYSEVLEKFRDDCQNKDGVLNHLYDLLFT